MILNERRAVVIFEKNSILKNHSSASNALSEGQKRIINFFFVSTVIGVLAAMLGITLYYVYAFASLSNGSHAFDWLLGIFSDFVTIMDASLMDSPYEIGKASYPPFAIAILYPFALICKNVFSVYTGKGLTVDELTSKVVLTPQFWIAIVLFFVICTSLIIFTVVKLFRIDLKNSVKIGAIIIFSAPFVYAIMRGNTIYFALIFLLFFMLLKNSSNAVLREISYICLAFAGLIKIYPLFFGVFLLRDKKIFASIRVAVYFFIGSFLSFFIYRSGLADFSLFVKNLGSFATDSHHLLSGTNLSLTSIMYKLFDFISPASANGKFFSVLNISILVIIFVLASITATVTRSTLSRTVIAASVLILIPSVSYFYVLIFEIIPFIQFIKDYDGIDKKKRTLYSALFFFLFFTLTILPAYFILHSLAVFIMFAIECYSVISKEIIPFFTAKKKQRTV
jgi:hypothetical protein